MRQPVVNEYRSGQGKNLGFILETAEGRGKNNAVIIA
jgi:hypothetical protein